MRSFTDYVAVVEFLVRVQGVSIEAALRAAEVPIHYIDQVKSYIIGPVEINSPDLLVEEQALPLCSAPEEDVHQPCMAALRSFLLNERRWSRSTVENLEKTSADLLCRLPQPYSRESFQIRGLVVGHIQSGKTANMSALIARAADQGYRLFIVLAGLLRDLRAQTQRRLDQEISGYSDDPERDKPYVMHELGAPRWVRMTNSGLDGDFQPGTHNDLNPQTPKLVILKKIPRVIDKFTDWLAGSPISLGQLPALVIDDEADQASVDTNYGRVDESGEYLDPSKTNKRIRELLGILPKCVYVGFTATPFANVLIDATVERDLFPRDFIAALPEPPGYFGPRQLFGLGMTPSELSEEAPEPPPLNVIRHILPEQLDELDELVLQGGACPRVLSDALWAFILSSGARLARGHNRHHFTMLVHPSQRTDDHSLFASAVSEELGFIRSVVARPRSFPDMVDRIRCMWEDDFVPVIRAAGGSESIAYGFDNIWAFVRSIADSIEVKTLNMHSGDELDYSGVPKRYIVIGGNRLSRGLTLEGLGVSFFTRDTNYYDTLLQMGRWFGFRAGYHDLTRIYVEKRLADSFADLARVELELRNDLKKYASRPNPPTPRELAPRIRVHPSMVVTSPMKLGAARSLRISFQGTTQNTVSFPTDEPAKLRANQDAARALIRSLGSPSISRAPEGVHIWLDIDAEKVIGFLNSYAFGPRTQAVARAPLVNYIRRQNSRGGLLRWDIVVPRGNPNLEPFQWSGEVFSRRVLRSPLTPTSIKVLQSPGDIDEWQRLAGRQVEDPALGCLIMYIVDKGSGLSDKSFFTRGRQPEDIVGFVLVFPQSSPQITTQYISQHLQ